MRIDFATLAFGYSVKAGGGTPNWATALGQGKDYKINDNQELDALLKGVVYSSVSLDKVSTKIGKGGRIVSGDAIDSPILIASLFKKVFINDTLINNGQYILIITRDTSESHAGRLRFKYGPSNSFKDSGYEYSNEQFWDIAKKQLSLAEHACYFVYDISVRNQDELVLRTVIVDKQGTMEYENSVDHHKQWDGLIEADIKSNPLYSTNAVSGNSPGEKDANRIPGGLNILLYGVPGSGKSYTIQNEYCNGIESRYCYRLVFHPDYTHSDFVGQILPKVDMDDDTGEKTVSYEFTPGPFTKILRDAYRDSTHKYILIIEEINRGNAPAIFGEIFQLLDRKSKFSRKSDGFPLGTSEYYITNDDIANYVYGDSSHGIRIPSNLTFIATMNTSDQNVFTLDTAFQRRWQMRQIENTFDRVDESFKNMKILDTGISWEKFCTIINRKIVKNKVSMASSEDKRLGVHFVNEEDLIGSAEFSKMSENEKKEGQRRFPEKVIKYLWDDAFKFNPQEIFDVTNFDSLEQIIHHFVMNTGFDRFGVFNDTMIALLSQPLSKA